MTVVVVAGAGAGACCAHAEIAAVTSTAAISAEVRHWPISLPSLVRISVHSGAFAMASLYFGSGVPG